MSLVVIKIKLSNSFDFRDAARGRLAPGAVRSVEINALADAGAFGLCIPEEIAEALGVDVPKTGEVITNPAHPDGPVYRI